MWVMGRMSDQEQADEYRRELEKSCDEECRKLGNRWSIIYEFCGFTLMLLAVNGIAQAIGAYNFHARAIAACCGCLLGCVNFAAIITTCVFRFNIMGRYSTLSLMPSQYDQPFDHSVKTKTMIMSSLSDNHTYESDGHLIMLLWVGQLFLCCLNCCISAML